MTQRWGVFREYVAWEDHLQVMNELEWAMEIIASGIQPSVADCERADAWLEKAKGG
jgi:hypothetical protein